MAFAKNTALADVEKKQWGNTKCVLIVRHATANTKHPTLRTTANFNCAHWRKFCENTDCAACNRIIVFLYRRARRRFRYAQPRRRVLRRSGTVLRTTFIRPLGHCRTSRQFHRYRTPSARLHPLPGGRCATLRIFVS